MFVSDGYAGFARSIDFASFAGLSPAASDDVEDDAGDEVVFRQKSLMRLDSHSLA